jgi:hypothetical protein
MGMWCGMQGDDQASNVSKVGGEHCRSVHAKHTQQVRQKGHKAGAEKQVDTAGVWAPTAMDQGEFARQKQKLQAAVLQKDGRDMFA